MTLRIGVDFDGVISDPTREKQLFAKKYFGVDLHPADCTTRRAKAVMPEDYYKMLIKMIEYGPDIANFDTTPHCAQALAYLRHHGHYVVIITTLSSKGQHVAWAKHLLNKNGVPFDHWVSWNVDDKPDKVKEQMGPEEKIKRWACEKLKVDVMIDDDVRNLDPMIGTKRLLLLFDQPWNRDVSAHNQIIRVFGWHDAITKIDMYAQGVPPNQAYKFLNPPKWGINPITGESMRKK